MTDPLNKASEEVNREARKLEARLDDYLADEAEFVKSLRDCIDKLKALHKTIDDLAGKHSAKRIDEIIKLKEESEKAFSCAVIKQGKAEHERSHLLESYGAIFWALRNLEKDLTTINK